MSRFATLLLLPWLSLAASAAPFTDFEDNAREITDFTGDGKWLVVLIWASDCHVCNREAHRWVDFHEFHQEQDARVLGVSLDGPRGIEQARAFIERHEINFPNLIGPMREIAAWYRDLTGQPLAGTPAFLLYDPTGNLSAAQVGAVPPETVEAFIARQGQ